MLWRWLTLPVWGESFFKWTRRHFFCKHLFQNRLSFMRLELHGLAWLGPAWLGSAWLGPCRRPLLYALLMDICVCPSHVDNNKTKLNMNFTYDLIFIGVIIHFEVGFYASLWLWWLGRQCSPHFVSFVSSVSSLFVFVHLFFYCHTFALNLCLSVLRWCFAYFRPKMTIKCLNEPSNGSNIEKQLSAFNLWRCIHCY